MSDFITMQNQVLGTLPGMPRMVVKSELNRAYNALAHSWEWIDLERTFVLTTIPEYSTGTVSVNVGSRAVTGVGTSWDSTYEGAKIKFGGDYQAYDIDTVQSGTSLTLKTDFSGSSDLSGSTYSIRKTTYSLDPQAYILHEIIYDVPLTERSSEWLHRVDPYRTESGSPTAFIKRGKNSNGVLQVELYPVPDAKYLVSYVASVKTENLTNDSDVPLLNSDLIVYKAIINMTPMYVRITKDTSALSELGAYKTLYNEMLNDLISEDIQRHSSERTILDKTSSGAFGDQFWINKDNLEG